MKKEGIIKVFNKNSIIKFLIALLFVFSVAAITGCNEKSESDEIPKEITTYSITYAGVDGAINPNTATTFNAETETITLKAPTKDGFIFQGWTCKGEPITELDTSFGQDVTLVANWSEHYCHLELDWGGLTANNRFYFVGEPFSTSFYLYGQYISLAPKVLLVFGENYDATEIQYYSRNIRVSGFDSATAGIKHVTIDVFNIPAGIDSYYNATISYDIEVKDYDCEMYGYESVPENREVVWPSGFTLAATPKNEKSVAQYNWMSSNEDIDHIERCSSPNYYPYDFFVGSSAFTNTLIVPSTFTDSKHETFKLLTIYDDLTRVYTDEIVVSIVQPETYDNYARLAEYVFCKGETFDLAEHGIGTGTILFHENGKEFTFANVNFANENYTSDHFITSTGFEFFYNSEEENHYVIHLVGNNVFINTFDGNGGGTGITITVQHMGNREGNNSDLTIEGAGSLKIVGGEPALYVGCPLIIDGTEVSFDSYMGRLCNGLNAEAIWIKGNSYVHATNRGTGLLAMTGGILIDEEAIVDLRLAMPRLSGRYATSNAIYAAGDVMIYSKQFYISAIATADIYLDVYEGIEVCNLICSVYGNVGFFGAKGELHVLGSHSKNPAPLFGIAIGISTSEQSSPFAEKGKIYISDSQLIIDLQADLFNTAYAIYGVHDVTIESSDVKINERCISEMNGVFCSDGEIAVLNGSKLSVYGFRANMEANAFGIYTCYTLTLENSMLSVEFNSGVALLVFLGEESEPSYYEEEYVPTQMVGFNNVAGVGKASIMLGMGSFNAFETIYDLLSPNLAPATQFVVDIRE